MHICLIGPGSVGLFLAAHLAQHEQVTLVGRNFTAVTKQDVRVVGLLERQAQVGISPHIVDADLIMVTTKAIHLESVIPLLKNCNAPVVFWQNGLGINHLAKTQLPGVPLIRAFSWMGVVGEGAYTVRCNGFSHIALSLLQGGTSPLTFQSSLLNAGLATGIADELTILYGRSLV
jgi:ketopantoate reductase